MNTRTLICAICGQTFDAPVRGLPQKYCSDDCRHSAYLARIEANKLARAMARANGRCRICSEPIEVATSKRIYCSKRCSGKADRQRAALKAECGEPGCARGVLARGLCSTHYNREHQPDRHKKVLVACDGCGSLVEKPATKRYSRRFCSWQCRERTDAASGRPRGNPDGLRQWQTSPTGVAWAEARRAAGEARRAAARIARLTALESSLKGRTCEDCGQTYDANGIRQRFCSRRCTLRVKARTRRAREFGSFGTFTWTQVMSLFLAFDRCCAYCESPVDGQPEPDHVIPLSRDGHNTIGNILPCCKACNSDKRDLSLTEWAADRARRGLAPRITSWSADDRRFRHLTAQAGGDRGRSAA